MTKTLKIATAVLATTFGAGAAMAASQHEAVGKIEHINPNAQRLTVSNKVYRYNPQLVSLSLKRGEVVRIIYRMDNGHRMAVKILPSAT